MSHKVHAFVSKKRESLWSDTMCCAYWLAHLDAHRQVSEDCGLNPMRDCAKLQNRDVSDKHSVALSALLGIHEVLDAQRHRLLVEPPQQLQAIR